MRDPIVPTPVIGRMTHDWSFMERVLKLPGATATDLEAMHQMLGAGKYCGWIELFESALLKPLEPDPFIIEPIRNPHEALIIGDDGAGRSIALGSDGEQLRFYLIDWKYNSVSTCDTLHGALLKWSECTGSNELFAKPFHLSRMMTGYTFEASWKFETAIASAEQAVGAGGVGWRYSDHFGEHFLLHDDDKTFLVEIREGAPLWMRLHFDYNNR